MACKNWNARSSLCLLLLFVTTHSEETDLKIPTGSNSNQRYILEQKLNDSFVFRLNPNYKEQVTDKPTTTLKPRDEIKGCPKEFEGIPVCQGLHGELTQLRNTSCWFSKPRGLTPDMVVVKLVLYSVLVVVSILGNFYIIGAGLCDWYLSKQALCQGMVGLAFTDLCIVTWYYTEDLLTAKFPIDGYTPIGEVGCICRDMTVNILFAVNLFIIVIMFYERKHDAIVAENKFNVLTRQQSNMQRQVSAGSSHVSSQGVLITGGPQISPLGTPAINAQYADAFVFPEDDSGDAEIQNVSIPCCSTSKMRLKGVTTRQMYNMILIIVLVSFVRGILFANMIKYNLCAFADGTHFPTCEPDKLGNWNRLWVFLGDVGIVYIGSIVLVCYFARKIFYQLHMPYHHGKHIAGYPDRSKKFLLMGAVAAFTYTFLLPERASFIFVKVSKVSFDMITNIILRMLIYLNCAFKPLLYGLMYHELYYPLKIRIMGQPDNRKVTLAPSPPLDSLLFEENEPKMTEEERAELDRAIADEDQSKPSEAIIKMLREKVQEKKRREEQRLSSLGSSNNSVLMRQGSDLSNNGSGLCIPYAGAAFHGGAFNPAMNQYMQRSLSCNNAPYPYMGRPKLPSVSGPRDPCFQQSLSRNQQLGVPNFYTMGRGLDKGYASKNGYHLAGNLSIGMGMGMNDNRDSNKYLLKNGSAEIPYYSQQNLYSTSPRKPRKNKEAAAAAGYENNPLNQNGKQLKSFENGSIKETLTRSPSKGSKDPPNSNVPSLTAINGSPTTEEPPPSPFILEGSNGKEMGEERSSSSSNGSGCTEMTNISVVSLASGPRNSRRLSSTGSGSAQSSSPTPPTLPPRSPTGVHMFETITEQSPFDFSNSAIA